MATNVSQYGKPSLRGVPKLVIMWYRQNRPDHCFYCGVKLWLGNRTLDHVVPRCNGAAVKNNLVPCCNICNRDKAALAVSHFRARSQYGPLFFGEKQYLDSKAFKKALDKTF